jgi:hypothetical protein
MEFFFLSNTLSENVPKRKRGNQGQKHVSGKQGQKHGITSAEIACSMARARLVLQQQAALFSLHIYKSAL